MDKQKKDELVIWRLTIVLWVEKKFKIQKKKLKIGVRIVSAFGRDQKDELGFFVSLLNTKQDFFSYLLYYYDFIENFFYYESSENKSNLEEMAFIKM